MKVIAVSRSMFVLSVVLAAGGLGSTKINATEETNVVQSSTKSEIESKLEFFEKKVRPILYDNCFNCHSADNKEAGGLRVDDHRALLKGGAAGPAIVPGQPEKSVLVKRITHADDKKTMPPDFRLSTEQIEILQKWIADGAVWTELKLPDDVDQTLDEGKIHFEDLAKSHWAWQPLADVTVPEFSNDAPQAGWPRDTIDNFVLAKLGEKSLSPVADASKATLLKRVYFDLTGLPPSEGDLAAFVSNDAPDALAKVVDKLLESPAFGQRWGRHWLDVARYGESTGSARNLPYPHAWRYRDYVIAAFNSDKPFNQFILEQVAGDLLPATSPAEKREQLIATGFLALGVKDVNQRFKVRYDMDNVDEQIDTVSKAFLGLTVSCARCHDHKFDPVSTRDYYALAGIFASTEQCDALRNQMGGGGMAYYVPDRLIRLSDSTTPNLDPAQAELLEKKKEEAKQLREKFIAIRDSVRQQDRDADRQKQLQEARQAMQKAQEELVSLTDPAKLGPVALGVRDSKEISDTAIRIRGEAEKHGPVVKRGYLTALSHVPGQPIPDYESGRHQLARWIVHPSNSLTQRVVVNRIWKNLFGEGLVSTVDNFGSTGQDPSHPELLDYLAKQFVKDGWSTKKLVRKIVLSRTYQLSSQSNDAGMASDPQNKWLWRHSPRRLDAEELRDAMLSVSDSLASGAPSDLPSGELLVRELRNNGPEARKLQEYVLASKYRSVYLPMLRTIVPETLAAFDFVEQGMVTGKRETTTVAPQALYLLNSSFVRTQAFQAAGRLIAQPESSSEARVSTFYRKVLLREPTPIELTLAVDFIANYERDFAESIKSQETSEPASQVLSSNSEGNVEVSNVASAAIPATTNATSANEVATNGTTANGTPANGTPANNVVAATTGVGGAAVAANAAGAAVVVANPDDRPESEMDKPVDQGPEIKDPQVAAWTAWCQSLLCSAEFRYLR